ncbi:hypothetical protein AYI70_g4427 [Smittium culicis]|uniref:Uncharacterized protein n=1 Tax=Smittium culicis TaxID=133412 RepID=A0A1R1XZD0_9FUNG|nr:hypothetical protein AYI70_g4427 [Smittium culicis]
MKLSYLILCSASIFTLVKSLPSCETVEGFKSEEEELNQLYKDALEEGGNLIVYEGGDGQRQQARANNAFNQRFPGMNATFIVNFSKYHSIDIDNQLERNELIPSVAHLQTVHDFYRWKEEGKLMPFKTFNSDKVYSALKDPEYHFQAVSIVGFGPNSSTETFNKGDMPIEDEDFLKPQYKNRLVLTYPNDDDAVLYQFYKLIQRYGWSHIDRLIEQNVTWVRGSETPTNMISNGTFPDGVTFTCNNRLVPLPDSKVVIKYPKNSWFLAWGQNAAIFKKARHPAAAKLYVAWYLSDSNQKSDIINWSPRYDIPPKEGYRKIHEYTNTSPEDYVKFMLDRTNIEALKIRFEKLIGHPQGDSPMLDPNL